MSGNYIPPNQPRYLTPDDIPSGVFCRTVLIPDSAEWVALVDGALSALMSPLAWRQFGTLTEEEAAEAWKNMLLASWEVATCLAEDTAPFWDDPDGADAEGSPAVSTYSWSERIEDWAIAAFVAASGVPGAAVEYLTIAPRFRLLFKTGDFGGIARIFIDDVLFTEVDTFSDVAGLLPVDIVIPA